MKLTLFFLTALVCLVNSTSSSSSSSSSSYVELPTNNGPEKECFDQLRLHARADLIQQCTDFVATKWNRLHERDSLIGRCCALYDLVNCVQAEASTSGSCSADQLRAVSGYHRKTVDSLEEGECNQVPINKLAELCVI